METPCFVAVRFEICLPVCAGIFVNAQKMTDTARFGGPAAVAASANARLAVPIHVAFRPSAGCRRLPPVDHDEIEIADIDQQSERLAGDENGVAPVKRIDQQ